MLLWLEIDAKRHRLTNKQSRGQVAVSRAEAEPRLTGAVPKAYLFKVSRDDANRFSSAHFEIKAVFCRYFHVLARRVRKKARNSSKGYLYSKISPLMCALNVRR